MELTTIRQTEPPQHVTSHGPGGDDGQGPAPSGPHGAVERAVFCQHSIHDGHFPVAGLTVAEARRTLGPLLHIHPEAAAVINGQIVDEDDVIGENVEMLSFVKPSAVKG